MNKQILSQSPPPDLSSWERRKKLVVGSNKFWSNQLCFFYKTDENKSIFTSEPIYWPGTPTELKGTVEKVKELTDLRSQNGIDLWVKEVETRRHFI